MPGHHLAAAQEWARRFESWLLEARNGRDERRALCLPRSYRESTEGMESATMSIDPQRVEQVYLDSLAETLAPSSEHYVEVEGIVHRTAFDRRKLVTHADEVHDWLAQLPAPYRPPCVDGGGGGWSFLNACNDKDDLQWTGLHWRMEQLFQLGIGLGMAAWCGPRALWEAFPGGMPYVAVTLPEDVRV